MSRLDTQTLSAKSGPSKLTPDVLSGVLFVAFDFDGVFTDNCVYVGQDGMEMVRCWRSDGLGLQRLRRIGVEVIIISTETNSVVSVRADKLGVPCLYGVENKATAILSRCSELNISPQQTMYVGNDVNDIPAFRSIGVPVGVADAYAEVYPHILFLTQKPGGFGAVREICDLIFNARSAFSLSE